MDDVYLQMTCKTRSRSLDVGKRDPDKALVSKTCKQDIKADDLRWPQGLYWSTNEEPFHLRKYFEKVRVFGKMRKLEQVLPFVNM